MYSSRGSSQPRYWTHVSCVSCIGRRALYHWCHLGSPSNLFPILYRFSSTFFCSHNLGSYYQVHTAAAAAAKSLQSCPTLCDPIDSSPPGSAILPWTAAYQAPPSMGFSRQEYWSGVPLPSSWFYCINRFNFIQHKQLTNFVIFLPPLLAELSQPIDIQWSFLFNCWHTLTDLEIAWHKLIFEDYMATEVQIIHSYFCLPL